MKVLFVTGLYIPELEGYFDTKIGRGCLQTAPNNFQWAVTKGLSDNHVETEVISCPFLPCAPFYNKMLYTPRKYYRHSPYSSIYSLRYCCLIGCKSNSIKRQIKNYAEEWIRRNSDDDLYILVYHTIGYVMEAIGELKKEFERLVTCIIVTDLVDNYNMFSYNNSFLKRVSLAWESILVRRNYRFFDRFILLSRHMAEKIPEARGNNIVIEGIFNDSLSYSKQPVPKIPQVGRKILYAGVLENYSGVVDFCQAIMMQRTSNIDFYICGAGVCQKQIEDFSRKDGRIHFWGRLSHKEVLAIQQKMDFLVNPRQPDGNLTKYSFPSKTIEYMASGIPMIGFKLDGIPDEYYEHMYLLEKTDVIGMAEDLGKIIMLPYSEIVEKGEKASTFVLSQKTAKKQVSRIINFIKTKH